MNREEQMILEENVAQMLDISRHKEMEEDRKRYEERLSALNTYSRELNMAKSMEEIYELTLDAAEKTLGFEFADILIAEGKMLCLVAHRGYSKNLSLKLPLDGDKGITVRAARTGKPVFVPDISKEKAYVEGGEGIRSELAVPIKIGHRVLGVLNVESRRLDAFDERDQNLLEILASHAATAISNLKHAKNGEVYVRETRESQEKFERLFMDNPEAAVYLDPDYHILDINPRFKELFGYFLDEVKGKHIDDVIVPKDKMEEAEMLDKEALKGYVYHDTVRKRKDGSLVPVSISAARLTVEGQLVGYVGLYKDITERRRFEERLSALNTYSRSLNMAESMEEIYRLTLDAMEKTLGFENGAFMVVDKDMLYVADQRGFPEPYLSLKLPLNGSRRGITVKAAKTGKPVLVSDTKKERAYVEVMSGIRSELDVPIKVGHKVLGVLNVESKRVGAFDEKDQKLLEILASHAATAISNLEYAKNLETRARQIRESQEKFKGLFLDNPEAAVYLGPYSHIFDINPRFEELFGYCLDEVKGKHINDVIVPKDKMEEGKLLDKKAAEGYVYYDTLRKRKDGSLVPVSISAAPLTVEGRFVGVVALYKDITERRRFEERLSALHTYSRSLNTAESMDEIYRLTLDAMERTLGFELASFMVVDKDMLCAVDQCGYPESFSIKLPLDGSQGGVSVKTARTGRSILVPDAEKEDSWVEFMSGMRSSVCVPIKIGGKVFGVLVVESKKLDVFDEKDQRLLEILASHAATAISDLRLHARIEKRSKELAALMKTSTEMMRTKDLRQRLKVIAEAIQGLGWRRAVIALNDENLDTTDLVTVGLTPEEEKYLWDNRQPGHVWRERFGPEYERFRIGEFYYLPWSDPFVREHITTGVVYSKIAPEEMVDWDPQDLLYAPLRLSGGRIVGRISVDDPLDGRRPTKESLAPLELFLYQAAVAIENAQLIRDLEMARNKLKEHADQLELKVEERTRELVESEKKYSTLVEHANDGVVIIQDGRLSFMNKRVEEMMGYSREELIGKFFLNLVPESEVELVKSRYEERMKGKPVPAIYETKALSKNGDVIPIEVNVALVNYGGKPADLVMIRDISERKTMEEQLLKAEKLVAIGELAASVGHDLRNPLTGMSGAVYYLKMKLASKMDEKSREMLDLIEGDIKYSNKIVNDLLDFSGKIHLHKTKVGIKSLIRRVLSRIDVPKKVKILDLTGNTPKVLVDGDQMMRAFQNLIANAIEALPKGGRLEIKSEKTGNCIKIVFRDTGVGIPRRNLNKLFTPLFTTKAKGVGMGLAICKRIINAHRGSINIKSKEGEGTVVTVNIPIRKEKNERKEIGGEMA